jgi:hypothetical protein
MDGEQHSSSDAENGLVRSSILGAPRQRRILSILWDRDRPTTVDALRVRLDSDAADADRRELRADLHHRCLPKLEAAGWIERRPRGYVLADPLPLETERLSLPDLGDPDHPSWDAASVLLARPRRQDVLSVVAGRSGRLTVSELAAELRDRERSPVGDGRDRSLPTELHHVDLPVLDDVGLVEYDPDGRTVAPAPRLPTCIDRLDLDTD